MMRLRQHAMTSAAVVMLEREAAASGRGSWEPEAVACALQSLSLDAGWFHLQY